MADDSKPSGLMHNKLVQGLAVIALALGIVAEGYQIYNSHLAGIRTQEDIDKVRAEKCSARVKAATENMSVEDMKARRAPDLGDCEPFYAEKKTAKSQCDTKFATLLDAHFRTDTFKRDPDAFTKDFDNFKDECSFSVEWNNALKATAEADLKRQYDFMAGPNGKICRSELERISDELDRTGDLTGNITALKKHWVKCPLLESEKEYSLGRIAEFFKRR